MIEVLRTRYAVKQTTDNLLVETTRGEYDEASVEFDKPPRATFTTPDPSGVIGASVLREGKEFAILRGVNGASGERRFTGIIETVELDDGDNGGHVTVRGVHKGYRMLQQHMCDTYDWDEDGSPATSRDGVTINPHRFFIFRQPGGPLDVRGDPLPIDGVNFADAMRHLIGTRFVHQVDLLDNSYFRASQVYAATNKLQVWRDGESGDVRPALQRNRATGAGFVAGGTLETVPLENGSPLIDPMGDIGDVVVTLIGKGVAGQDPSVALTRCARNVLVSDLAARYKLDELSGTSAADSGANGLTGTWAGVNVTPDTRPSFDATTYRLGYLGGLGYTKYAQKYVTVSGGMTLRAIASNVGFYMRRVGSPTGLITVRVSTTRASGGVTATIDAAAVNTSITTTYASVPTTTVLAAGTTVYVSVEYAGGDSSNYIELKGTSSTQWGHEAFDGTNWFGNTTDLAFLMHTQIEPHAAGKYDGGALLTLGTEYVSVPSAAALNPSSEMTLAAWLKASSKDATLRTVAEKQGQYALRKDASGNLVCEVVTADGTFQATVPSADWAASVWHHIALTYDGASLKAYLDGVLKATTAASGAIVSTANAFTVGHATAGILGTVDEVTLHGRALTPSEVVKVRDADAYGPFYTANKSVAAANVLYDDAVTDTGLDRWVISFSSSDFPNVGSRTSLGVKITLPGSDGDASTTKLYYMKVSAVTASDTGIAEGSIAAYSNPVALRSDIDPGDWVDTDLSEKNRLVAIETLRKLTESGASNPNPHWDAWVDDALQFHFAERRGVDVANHEYSFREGNLRKVSQQYNGNEIAYQTVAYGAGSGVAQMRIVTNEEYSAGGLYDADRDPKTAGALYGQLARVMSFVDENERSPVSLYRKARAFHKLHRQPVESLEVEVSSEFIRHFSVGDSIQIKNLRSRTSGLKRVVELKRVWDGSAMERLRLRLGNPLRDIGSVIANQAGRHDTLVARAQPAQATTGLSGSGVNLTKDHYGFYSFGIPEGAIVERVILRMTTLPWQITATGAASGGGATATSASGGAVTVSSASGGGATVTSASGGSSTPTSSGSLAAGTTTGGGSWTVPPEIDYYSLPGMKEAADLDFYAYMDQASRVIYIGVPNGATPPPKISMNVGFHNHGFNLLNHTHNVTLPSHTHDVSTPNHSHIVEVPNHSHDVTLPAHTHNPKFGIWQFDGDAGSGTGTPVYGTGIMFAVDPSLTAAGIPSTFATERHPTIFGKADGSQTVEVDVTGYLAVDANGFVKSGEHRVYLLATAGASNAQGLAVVSVTPILRFRQ